MRIGSALCLLAAVSACARPQAPPPTPAASVAAANPAPVTSARSRPDIAEAADLRAHFEAERATGTIALFDTDSGHLVCSDVEACQRPRIPASTFKIPHTLIALETGVVEDSETPLPWDQKIRPIADWNQDHTLRSAVRVSCVPCFQSIARSIGAERMRMWVDALGYGNRDLTGGIDGFWLWGGLRISPVEQIDFLRRLDGAKLPVSTRSREILIDVIALDVGQNHVLRGKTGLARPPETPTLVGWFVGWVEIGERRVFFATLIDSVSDEVDIVPLRRRLTERILRARSALPT